jgi:Tol biopolymer transport system component
MAPSGNGQNRLTTNTAVDIQPAWSPDGTRLAFSTNRHGALNFELYTMSWTGRAATRLTMNPAGDGFPDW